mmetsp:Transcript_4688/g.11646  ORF Transcript_4688/g.11646 Transcript_4688/m.11646 type:complete len:350 (-) Transcript_4688:1894-2943(-)
MSDKPPPIRVSWDDSGPSRSLTADAERVDDVQAVQPVHVEQQAESNHAQRLTSASPARSLSEPSGTEDTSPSSSPPPSSPPPSHSPPRAADSGSRSHLEQEEVNENSSETESPTTSSSTPSLQEASPSTDTAESGEAAHRAALRRSRSTMSSPFECGICLETASSPVVSLCGHLFCWPCIHRWLEMIERSNRNTCPVCKAYLDQKRLIPVYSNSDAEAESAADSSSSSSSSTSTSTASSESQVRPPSVEPTSRNVPPRPSPPPRVDPPPVTPISPWGTPMVGAVPGGGGFHVSAGFGFFPSLFGLQFQHFPPLHPTTNQQVAPGEQRQRDVLSRFLLCLGIAIVFCLLL